MKNKKNFFISGLILISFLYLFVRLYKFDELIGFRLDQGVHLLETKEMMDLKKIRLVGPMVTSKSFMGRNFFIGANYYYVLAIIGILSRWDPMVITVVFVLIELVFYLFFIGLIKKRFGSVWSLWVWLFITISPYLVIHSRFFWNPHLLVPISILLLYWSEKCFLKGQLRYLFLMAIGWGFAFSCHYSAIFWGLFLLWTMFRSRLMFNLKAYFLVIMGFVLGDLPFLIFELRHGFYNTKTLWYVFGQSSQSGDITSHYFIFPLFVWVLWILMFLISKFKKMSNTILILTLILLFLIQIKIFKNYSPLYEIKGWNYLEQKRVVELIIKDGCPNNFEVAATVQGDTRAYDLRYLLNIKKCNPLGVEDYPKAERLFLVAPTNRQPENEKVWEVISLGKFEIKQRVVLNSEVVFYELERKN